MGIRAAEHWDGTASVYIYAYFLKFRFGLRNEAKYPGKTFSHQILTIETEKR